LNHKLGYLDGLEDIICPHVMKANILKIINLHYSGNGNLIKNLVTKKQSLTPLASPIQMKVMDSVLIPIHILRLKFIKIILNPSLERIAEFTSFNAHNTYYLFEKG
jgi:hypothetical protein